MASSKQFWLYTVSLIFFTSHVYAGCSNATLKGNYSVQGVVQIQGKQCQISGNWLLDGKGGGLEDSKGGNCPELAKPEITPFQYKLNSNCRGRSTTANNSHDFQVMPDGSIKVLQGTQIKITGTFNHTLTETEANTIEQHLARWSFIDILNKWSQLGSAGLEAQKSGNFQEAEKNFRDALVLAKTNMAEGATWDDLIEAGIKAGEAGDFIFLLELRTAYTVLRLSMTNKIS
jgi:hypothetical protein